VRIPEGEVMNGLLAAYAIAVAVFMAGFWGFLVATGHAELKERPWDMRLHLAAEFTTASFLVLSGAGSFLGLSRIPLLASVALGVLLYTVVNSPGFYAVKGNWPMVGMFAVLSVLTAAAILGLLAFGLS